MVSRCRRWVAQIVDPTTAVHGPMRTARVSTKDLRQVVRSQGHARLSDISSIVLESDGTVSVLTADPRPLAD